MTSFAMDFEGEVPEGWRANPGGVEWVMQEEPRGAPGQASLDSIAVRISVTESFDGDAYRYAVAGGPPNLFAGLHLPSGAYLVRAERVVERGEEYWRRQVIVEDWARIPDPEGVR